MKNEFIIYTRMLEIHLWLFDKTSTFPKKQRFVLGQQIENSSLACMRYIIEANNSRGAEKTIARLDALNVELEVLRGLLRVAFEVKFMKARSLGHITNRIDEVGKMCGGWIKKMSVKLPAVEQS
ncbi:MAG: diversity-generating retroelement protein Avd [Candidatus Microsaccharimonas sp.]